MQASLRSVLALGIAAVLITGCAHKKAKITGGAKSTTEGVTLWANYVKDKSKRFDVELNISNDTGKSILIASEDIQCFRGGTRGVVKDNFDDRDRLMNFSPGQARSLKVTCNKVEGQGSFRIVLARVFSNPNNDGGTKGPLLASDVTWNAMDSEVHR